MKKNLKNIIQSTNPLKEPLWMSDDQKVAFDIIKSNDIIFLNGNPGSGKTWCAVSSGLYLLAKKSVKTIILTKPAIATEELGFLPGDVNSKYERYIKHMKLIIEKIIGKSRMIKYLEDESIIIEPMAFWQGITFDDSYVVVDESENLDKRKLYLAMTRLGKRSKMVFTGDEGQSMIKNSGYDLWIDKTKCIEKVSSITMKACSDMRNPIVEKLAIIWKDINV